MGGPPCQGFSMAGNIGRKFLDDDRNSLFKEFARVVSIINPDYFVIENVARLYTHNKEKSKIEIINTFENQGYHVSCKVLNTVDFGVPQLRNRIIFIGNKISNNIIFPKNSIDNTPKTVKEAIHDLPVLQSGETSNIYNHIAMKHSNQMLEKMFYVSDGGNRCEIPNNIRPKSGDIRKYIRYNSKKPSFCITGDMRKVFHYEQNRALTVRELARLQSFPDSFEFKGTSISQQQQVGNAVPPLFAQHIASSILEMIKNDKQNIETVLEKHQTEKYQTKEILLHI